MEIAERRSVHPWPEEDRAVPEPFGRKKLAWKDGWPPKASCGGRG